ncbi:GlcG/HbpS family heme-binding protein [Polymorphobacter fuscus]|uniref:Heme-binding protein n=1 Tax=Sandarakinorhabdus fusca TaxID=1439888 RepID=A0A7C9KIL2_9SPHN|nr:heme-binding protein [Polymorphobacter fuscus]KAB7646196.1 heme-binding protein [Polymorphobacter fuscus]MQT17399.1 heme-binding protein [Polymorphobacter fuscus]NJC10067.1 uncharacterized protein GlcG (DUF336 family) [Polymorphobacter fuscus]
MSGAFLILASATALSAPGSPLERGTVSLVLANRLASAAIAACTRIGREAAVAVVDRGGNLVALQRGDDVGPHNTVAAQRKAFTALSTKSSTTALAARAASDPTSRNLTTMAELLLVGGGQPITAGGSVIGGIGVAGAGGSANDDRCALEAIADVFPPAVPGR